MKREKMLEILSDLPYALIWPDKWWEEIGFTEREIWVNGLGCGFICCDEPTGHWEGTGLREEEWKKIEEKKVEETLEYNDIRGTCLEELLVDTLLFDAYDFNDQKTLIKSLENIGNGAGDYLAAIQIDGGILFYDSEDSYMCDFSRDWADDLWEDMDDELLAEWIDRLSIQDDSRLIAWSKKHGLLKK